jgi:uncharacterized protein with PIN domain
LTRDRHLIHRLGPAPRLYVESDYYHEQVRQVVQAFHLTGSLQIFSRCLRCNATLLAIAKPSGLGRVPPYVYATQMTFKHCVICDQLYWGGTHRDNMLRQLQTILSGLPGINPEALR